MSKLGPDELFAAISEQISKVMKHDLAVLTLCNPRGGLDVHALHAAQPHLFQLVKDAFSPEWTPAAEALATGEPVVAYLSADDRYPSPEFRRYVELGCRSICSAWGTFICAFTYPYRTRRKMTGNAKLGRAWVALCLALVLHVTDEALTGFLREKGVQHERFGHRLIASVEDGSELYREISDHYCAGGCTIRMATLEDVFLRLTGRELRE